MQGQRTAYRYSDSSQYDNVPTRMRGSTSSPGILKKQRDVSFADPRRSRDYRQTTATAAQAGRDEIEMLEECFDALRTSTTTTSTQATQTTGVNGSLARRAATQTVQAQSTVPTTPNDPGFVRHMSSNWPQMMKNRERSPEREHNR